MADPQRLPDNTPTTATIEQPIARWGNLSPLKIAKISLCDKNGVPEKDGGRVEAILTEADFNVESNYQSPFEASNPEHRMPTLLGMLQSGEITSVLAQSASGDGLAGQFVAIANEVAKTVQSMTGLSGGFTDAVQSLEGKSNLTKINSIQIFVSTNAIQIPLTLFFQAIFDANKEVESQIKLLESWCLPKELAESLVASVADKGVFGGLFPSTAAPYIRLEYGGKIYAPFFITSVSSPLVGPTDKDGNRLSATVSVNIISRGAWDRGDIEKLYSPQKANP